MSWKQVLVWHSEPIEEHIKTKLYWVGNTSCNSQNSLNIDNIHMWLHNNLTEIHLELLVLYGEHVMNRKQVLVWYSAVKEEYSAEKVKQGMKYFS